MDIIYRPARKEDCPKLGELFSMAGEGLLEFMLDGLMPGMSAVDVAAYDMADDKDGRSYRGVTVADVNGEVKAMAFSYHSRLQRITDDMRKFIPGERLAPLETFYSTRVEDSLYLDTLAVDDDLRGQGVGGKLLEMTKQKAREMGLGSLSLIVYTHNTNALGIYRKQGFQEVKEIPMEGPEVLSGEGAAVLMECKLTAG